MSPTSINTSGKIIHCEGDFRAGHRNEANGKAGRWAPAMESVRTVSLLPEEEEAMVFFFFLGL